MKARARASRVLPAIALAIFVGFVVNRTFGTGPGTAPAIDPARLPPLASPMIGTNLTHSNFEDCSGAGNGILARYHQGSTRREVQKELRTMRLQGVETIRIIIWHMSDASRQDWGVVSSAEGRLLPQVSDNLANFVIDVRRSRYRRLTVAFGPVSTNNPIERNYRRDKLDENWRFITKVRAIVKRVGPLDTHFDLLNEGASSRYQPAAIRQNMAAYVAVIYARYVRAFGAKDVVISSIGARGPADRGQRLLDLVTGLRATGYPLPQWFEIHMNFGPAGVLHALREADSELGASGLNQPLVVGETAYNSAGAAEAIARFRRESTRKLDEVVQWYAKPGGCPLKPPYRVDAFRSLVGNPSRGAD